MRATDELLARRYRRWLLCYPPRYRRLRGDELVATLVDVHPPDRPRPRLRVGLNLVRHGLRCRLGRHRSRTVVVWSLLTAVTCGLFAAAMATRLGWETVRPQPDEVEALALASLAVPSDQATRVHVPAATFTYYGEPVTLSNVDILLPFDGGAYGHSATSVTLAHVATADAHTTVVTAEQRLRAAGWQVWPANYQDMPCGRYQDLGCTIGDLIAQRGDTSLSVYVFESASAIRISRSEPAVNAVLAPMGGVLGFVIGWLVFAWASRHSRRWMFINVLAILAFAATMLLWWAPILLTSSEILKYSRNYGGGQGWPHLWEWLGQPQFLLFFLVGCTAAATALLLALVGAIGPTKRSPARTEVVG